MTVFYLSTIGFFLIVCIKITCLLSHIQLVSKFVMRHVPIRPVNIRKFRYFTFVNRYRARGCRKGAPHQQLYYIHAVGLSLVQGNSHFVKIIGANQQGHAVEYILVVSDTLEIRIPKRPMQKCTANGRTMFHWGNNLRVPGSTLYTRSTATTNRCPFFFKWQLLLYLW